MFVFRSKYKGLLRRFNDLECRYHNLKTTDPTILLIHKYFNTKEAQEILGVGNGVFYSLKKKEGFPKVYKVIGLSGNLYKISDIMNYKKGMENE